MQALGPGRAEEGGAETWMMLPATKTGPASCLGGVALVLQRQAVLVTAQIALPTALVGRGSDVI